MSKFQIKYMSDKTFSNQKSVALILNYSELNSNGTEFFRQKIWKKWKFVVTFHLLKPKFGTSEK